MPRPQSNPPQKYSARQVEWEEQAPPSEIEVGLEQARSILSENDSPDLGFRWSLNPYRGCQHACAYCYARPTHQYLGFGAGTDFDTRLVVKLNAAELLARELSKPSWKRQTIVFSGVTDCYQALERRYVLTRRCLELCLEHRTPVTVITKSPLVLRDAELLAALSRATGSQVHLSIAFADDELARKLEPGAPPPSKRFQTLAALSAAGVSTGLAASPILPGLNDEQLPALLARAAAAGATRAFLSPLRLPAETRQVFEERVREVLPERADRLLHALEELRGGRLNEARFHARFAGQGPRWQLVEAVFRLHCRRLGLCWSERLLSPRTARV